MAGTLESLLEQYGLDQSAWISKFHEIGIIKPEDIENIQDQTVYQNLFSEASEAESQSLQKLLDVTLPDEEEIEKDNKQALEIKFEGIGLDPVYWAPKFNAILGVRSPEALEYVGNESYVALEPYIKNATDKLILRTFFSCQSIFERCRNEQARKFDQRKKKIKKLLEKFHTKVMYLSDTKKKNLVISIFELLQIVPDIPSDVTLEEVVRRLNIQFSQLVVENSELSDKEVFSISHEGCALKGFFLAPTVTEHCKMQYDLLKDPQNIKFLNPRWSQFTKIIHFSQKKDEYHLMDTIKYAGVSAITSAEENPDADDSFAHDHVLAYRSTLKCVVVPMAACYLDDEQLELSPKAIKKLQEIEAIQAKIEVKGPENEKKNAEIEMQQFCETFFHTFGSHAYKGIYHFGGIFIFKSHTTECEITDIESVKLLQSKAIEFVANSIWLPDEIKIQSGISKNEPPNLIHKTKSETIVSGGPKEFTSYFQWKNGLTINNSTWRVIDHGTDILPVWKIMQVRN